MEWAAILLVVVCSLWLSMRQASAGVWFISLAILLAISLKIAPHGWFFQLLLCIGVGFSLLQWFRPLRRWLISKPIMQYLKQILPSISSTEREALEAGTITWEGDVFSGAPDFEALLQLPTVELSNEENAYLEGTVNELCRMIDDWDITHNRTNLPPEIWDFIAENGFFGMIIPKEYGGLGFSATAQKAVLVRLYSCSISVATTVGVPNSLGPAELLIKYGTKEQRDYYLPRLAKGVDIPCFALTGPNAGSDAASIPDTGMVCMQTLDGKEILGLRLNWNKRYITLAPIATLIGLAFRMFDPDNLLGKGEDLGISCALIPVHTPGVVTGRRHFPLNSAFLNGPTQGKDVFIPLTALIGGADMAGQGWRMLMDCLSAGRAISLPSSACAGGQLAALTCGAYARVRQQFNLPICQFEGIEEPLARIAGNAYIIDSGMNLAMAAIDHGHKPAVAGAILKYHTTERARKIALDAMDIHGGKGICLGPKNYIGRGYQGAPISITVEGANILTRCLIIYGQGAIRCHPYVFKEMESVRINSLHSFDAVFWGHASFVAANFVRSIVYGLTDGHGVKTPKSKMRRYYQLIGRYSSQLAYLSDVSMVLLGGSLKRREKLSARLGDMLSNLYLTSAVLKRFYVDGEPLADKPLAQWSCEQLLFDCETAMANIIANFPNRFIRAVLRLTVLPFGRRRLLPSDALGGKLAKILTTVNATRSRLAQDVFKEPNACSSVGQLEKGMAIICEVKELENRVLKAWKKGDVRSLTAMERIEEALEQNILTSKEAERVKFAEKTRQAIITVDDFDSSELQRMLNPSISEENELYSSLKKDKTPVS